MGVARRPDLVRVVCVLAALCGAGALALAAILEGDDGASPWLTLAFVGALAAAQVLPLHLPKAGESEALHLEEVFFVPMVLLLAPSQTLVAFAAGVTLANLMARRGLWKVLFNAGMLTASAGIGIAVASVLGAGGPVGGRDLAAAAIGGLVHCAVSAVAVSAVIALASGSSWLEHVRGGLLVRVATWCGSLSLGVLVVMAAEAYSFGLAVSVVPVLVLQYAYSGALRQWREREEAERLYDAAGRIRARVDTAHVRSELVETARELLGARSTRIVDSGAEAASRTALRVQLDEVSQLEVDDRVMGGRWRRADAARLQALVAVARGALDNALLYEQMRAVTQSLGEGVLALDVDGVITFANPAAESLLGWGPGALTGKDIAVVVDPATTHGLPAGEGWVHLPRVRAGQTVRLDEHVVTRADARPLDVALTASPVVRDGEVVGAVVVLRDVRERMALERRLVHQAFHDPLTGLPNRALFLDRLEHARARSRDSTTVQAVLFVDLDRFKVINDSLGHRAGDDVLCTVASRMVGVLRDGDTVARFGGDEFTVLLEELKEPGEATAAAERIVRALRRPIRAADREVVLSASIGVAVAEPGNEPGDLLAAADIAMYEAKSAGKDRWSIAAADADDRALARLDLEMELRRAIAEDELELHYQPVVHADGGELYGLEALVRWRHPTLGLLAPSSFMDLAEDTGLILPMGEWVLERACRDGRAWHDRHPGCSTLVAVNLSARQFTQPDLRERVAEVLARTGFDPSLLVLEITETVVMQDTEAVLDTLDALRGLRVKLAVDDFGTGFSSLSYLKRFPVDTIKIDKSFVDGLGSSDVDREIVAAVVRLANAVGMHTVAEGVETTRQLDQLRLLGCSAVQGFLIAAPQPIADVERILPDITAAGPRRHAPQRRLRSLS